MKSPSEAAEELLAKDVARVRRNLERLRFDRLKIEAHQAIGRLVTCMDVPDNEVVDALKNMRDGLDTSIETMEYENRKTTLAEEH